MFCAYCGSPIEKDGAFCVKCGKPVAPKASSSAGNRAVGSSKGMLFEFSDYKIGPELATACMDYIEDQELDMKSFWETHTEVFCLDFETLLTSEKEEVDKSLKRGRLELMEQEWEEAKTYFDRALDEDAECAEAYFGRVLCELKASTLSNLFTAKPDFMEGKNYKRIMRFATEEKKSEFQRLEDIYLRTNILTAGIISKAISKVTGKKEDSDFMLAMVKSYFDEPLVDEEEKYIQSNITDIINNATMRYDIYMHKKGRNSQEVKDILYATLGLSRDNLDSFLAMLPAYIKKNISHQEMTELKNKLLAAGAEVEIRVSTNPENDSQKRENVRRIVTSPNKISVTVGASAKEDSWKELKKNIRDQEEYQVNRTSASAKEDSWNALKTEAPGASAPNLRDSASCVLGGSYKGIIGSGRWIPESRITRMGGKISIFTKKKIGSVNYELERSDITGVYTRSFIAGFRIFGVILSLLVVAVGLIGASPYFVLAGLFCVGYNFWVGHSIDIVIDTRYNRYKIPVRYEEEMHRLDGVLGR